MFSRIHNFLSRHKRKFITVGVVFGAGAIALHYARKKLQEFQEAQAKEFLEKTRRLQHFESTERTCNQAIHSLYPNVVEVTAKLYDTDAILQELREKASELSTQQKLDLWNQLLVKSFTKIVTLVYSSTLLVLTLRIQLNILAGYIYKEIDSETKVITQELQNSYLSFVQHFLRDGINDLALLIRNSTERVLKKYDLKQKIGLAEIEQIFYSIQMAVNADLESNQDKTVAKIVLPAENSIPHGTLLRKVLVETIDMLETDEIFNIITTHLGQGFSTTTDEIANFFTSSNNNNIQKLNGETDTNIVNITQVQIPVAKLIPIVNGLAPKTLNEKPLPNSLLTMLINSDKIKMLGANVYEVFGN